jgi:hypothetical protein
MNFYDILQDILLKKSGNLDEDLEFSSNMSGFMVARYLSMKDDLIIYADVVNHFNSVGINDVQIYKWCYNNVPKQKSGFIKYIKKAKKKEAKK